MSVTGLQVHCRLLTGNTRPFGYIVDDVAFTVSFRVIKSPRSTYSPLCCLSNNRLLHHRVLIQEESVLAILKNWLLDEVA